MDIIKKEPPCDIFDEETATEMFAICEETDDICDEADNEIFNITEVADDILPEKSLTRYKHCYDAFTKWQESKGVNSFDEPLLLNYFHDLSKIYKPSSMWTRYSMLKGTIMHNHDIDISKYSRLMAFLKKSSVGFKSNKSKVFTGDEITKFLVEASDHRYLAVKTVSVFAVIGACRGDEVTYVMIDHIKDYGDEIIAKISDRKTKVPKTYSINGQYAEIVRKYMKLRPKHSTTNRFFLQYLNGKCTSQVLGKHTIGRMPKEIAKFLKLPEHDYSWHSIRRESTIMGDNTAGIEMNRREPCAVERCIVESLGNKILISKLNDKEINLPSTSNNVIIKSEPYENESTDRTAATNNVNTQHYENGKRYELSSNVQNGKTTYNLRVSQEPVHNENKSTIFQFFNCNNITFNISK